MFDIGWTEISIIMVLAIIVVGPKDLPRLLRIAGEWVGKAKALTREFRGHIDDIIRESELDEVKRQIESVGETSVNEMVEKTIDPESEIREAMDFSGDAFDDPLELGRDKKEEADGLDDDMAEADGWSSATRQRAGGADEA
jgi:sec-independent protein translocase protein TatB